VEEIRQILVAVDFSDVSANAFKAAAGLARRLNAKLKVVHAVPMQAASLPMEGGAVYIEDLQAKQVEEAKEKLVAFVRQHSGGGPDVEQCVRSGDPTTEINRAAEELRADMIVVGTHGRSGLGHLLMGSVAESVLREAEVPVLCVRG
jgi:nucleotide-binding universal stress UspA family protein